VKLRTTCVLMFSVLLVFAFTGCSMFEKASTMKNDIVNIGMEQIAWQLENSLNQQFPGVQLKVPQVVNNKGQIDWEQLKQTELGNYSFYSIGSYEFRSVLTGQGLFKIERINHATDKTYSYAEFKVQRVNGKFKVSAK
jgi:alpha-galactosidase